jgi:hypothetical protein
MIVSVAAALLLMSTVSSPAPDRSSVTRSAALTSWNPNVSCVPDLVTVQTILGTAYPAQSLAGSQYQVSSTAGGIPDKRALSPPCTIKNVYNTMVSAFVEVDSVYLYNYLFASGDCSMVYKPINGGGPYPNNQTFCDNTGNIRAMGTTNGNIHIEFDQDWLAKGYCGSTVSYCNNVTIAQKVSSGTISLNLQGFVYWDDTHWELHPLAAWKLTNSPPSAPTNLVATAGNAQVGLTWQAPASNGGSPITNYKIYRGTSSNGETLLATIGNVLTYTDTAVTNGVTYYYQVSAMNAAGEGPRSNEASATPSPPPPNFGISATPASLSIHIGSSGTSTITLTSLNGFAGTIGLTKSIACSGLCLVYPTASLNPTSVTLTSGGTGVSTLTVATSTLTTPGTYTITITATSGSITHTVTVTVTVYV